MSGTVAHILEAALLLPSDERTELVEAILERSEPSQDFLEYQVGVVARRMENVRNGLSQTIPAVEAHETVLQSFKPRK